MRVLMGLAGTATLALAGWAVPASAQQLGESDIEFLAEVLAMGEICPEVNVNTQYDAVADYVASQITGKTQADLDAVLARRDEKIDALRSQSAAVRNITGGRQRETAVDEYVAAVATRCYRLADNDVTSAYFRRPFTPAANY